MPKPSLAQPSRKPGQRIPVAGPSISELEIAYVTEAARTAWYDGAHDFIIRFEKAFAAHTGRKYAISLPSATSGLHLALMALGVGAGDEVIVPDCTWIASVAPVDYVGATPIFVDIDRDSWCMSPAAFEAAITPKTKAAIVVDLYGSMPDWDELTRIADAHGVALIEDAAEAVGSRWRDRPAGAFGALAAFSFHGSKTLTTGEGGMLLLDDERLFDRVHRLRDHGRAPGDVLFHNEEVGWKYKMSALQAALGLAQIERLDELVAGKRHIFATYRELLRDWNHGTLNPDVTGLYNSYWMSSVVVDPDLGITKEALFHTMRERGVDVRPFFYPLTAIPAYSSRPQARGAAERNPTAYAVSGTAINLPSALALTDEELGRVVTTLKDVVATLSKHQ